MTAYYNEFDPGAAAWLRELIAQGHVARGIVDERSIEDVRPGDLAGFTQCHFFAGIGGWSAALRLAGWPDDRPVWTGSCPCQPFSAAGKGAGFADERHLWPAWFHLIAQRHPAVVFGEQVASKDGLGWFDLVHADLEAAGYAIGAADLCAAGVGAPHIRQRLWFVADGQSQRRNGGDRGAGFPFTPFEPQRPSAAGLLANRSGAGLEVLGVQPAREERATSERGRASRGVAHDDDDRRGALPEPRVHDEQHHAQPRGGFSGLANTLESRSPSHAGAQPGILEGAYVPQPNGSLGAWANAEWIACRDGKARPVESGTFPLAHGVPARVVRLRGYGNAIVPQVAAEFIRAYMT